MAGEEEVAVMGSYSAELLKFRRRPAVWVVMTLWLALAMTFTYLFPYLSYRSATNPRAAQRMLADLLPSAVPGHVLTGYPMWGGALIVVLGALYLGSEYGWGTVKTMLSNRPGRFTFYLAQLATLVTALAGLVVVDFLLSGLVSVLIARSADAAPDLPAAGDVVRAMAAGWLILIMWCAFGGGLAILIRGTALSIGLGLVWVLAIESLIRGTASLVGAIGEVEKVLPGVNAGSLVSALGASTGLSGSAAGTGVAAVVGGGQALWVVVLYALAFAAAGAAVLRWRDVQ
jgi:ABC-2 type transport system permease protein